MIHRFEIALADVDRGVYQDLDLRVARHPSEDISYLVTRVLAYALEYEDGLEFSKDSMMANCLPFGAATSRVGFLHGSRSAPLYRIAYTAPQKAANV